MNDDIYEVRKVRELENQKSELELELIKAQVDAVLALCEDTHEVVHKLAGMKKP